MYAEEYRPVSSRCCFVFSNSSKRLLILIQFYLGVASHGSFTHTLINNFSVSLRLFYFIFKISPLNFLFRFIYFIFLWVCLSLGVSWEVRRGCESPGAGVTDSCELSGLGAGDQTQVIHVHISNENSAKKKINLFKKVWCSEHQEMAQLVRWVPCKHSDLNSDPQRLCENRHRSWGGDPGGTAVTQISELSWALKPSGVQKGWGEEAAGSRGLAGRPIYTKQQALFLWGRLSKEVRPGRWLSPKFLELCDKLDATAYVCNLSSPILNEPTFGGSRDVSATMSSCGSTREDGRSLLRTVITWRRRVCNSSFRSDAVTSTAAGLRWAYPYVHTPLCIIKNNKKQSFKNINLWPPDVCIWASRSQCKCAYVHVCTNTQKNYCSYL